MPTMLINAAHTEELRVALVDDNGLLYDYITERPGFEEKIGNIYLAEITSIEPSLDAVFVNFGSKRHGFLPLKEISPEYFSTQDLEKLERPNIKELLKEGQKLLVQVEKEERGNKGAALTTFISLAGSYLVALINNPRAGGISRRIEGEERDELREILSQLNLPAGMGLIVRTAGVGRSLEELQWDLNVLLNYWEVIRKASQNRTPPLLIHQESDVIIRGIRDYLQDIKEITIDSASVFEKARHYMEQVRPDYISRLKLYSEKTPLFIHHGIEHQIELAYQRTVRLKSGGSIVIDHTEALVSVDINSARATKGGDIEETAYNTNREAAEEIARQLRLRDIGGLIVIDFIDMRSNRNRYEIQKCFIEALKKDRARVQVGTISRFGLMEMSRQRLRPSLQEAIQEVCPYCNGQGSTRSIESLALSIIRIIEEDAMKENTAQIQLQLSSEAATYLLNEKRGIINDIEQRQHISVLIIPNSNIKYPNYQIKRLRKIDLIEQTSKLQSSYKLIESTEVEMPVKKLPAGKSMDQPIVRNLLPGMPDAPSGKKPMQGLIKRLWANMFGTPSKETSTTQAPQPQEPKKYHARKNYQKPRPRSNTPRPYPSQKNYDPKTVDEKKPHPRTESSVKPPQKPVDKPESTHKERPEMERHKREYTKTHRHKDDFRRTREKTHKAAETKQTPSATSEAPAKIESTETNQRHPVIENFAQKAQEQAPIIVRPDIKKEPTEEKNNPANPSFERETEK